MPAGRAGSRHSPFVPVTVCWVDPVWTALATTVTPGSTAPLGSTTAPLSAPVGLPCACAVDGRRLTLANTTHAITDPTVRIRAPIGSTLSGSHDPHITNLLITR